MRRKWQSLSYLPIGLLVFIAGPTVADLPYNPTTVLIPPRDDDAVAYVFTPDPSSSQFQLSSVPISKNFDASAVNPKPLYTTLPFLPAASRKSFTPIIGPEGNITVLSGDCAAGASQSEIWRFMPYKDDDSGNGTWAKLNLSITTQGNGASPPGGLGYLASAFAFSPTYPADVSFYSFGGMCPSARAAQSSSWTSSASYSNVVLEASSSSSDPKAFSLSITATTRSAPVPEAGLTITPLAPTFSNSSDSNPSQNQNFVLLGGHTESAFINMSQAALFSLPEASWTFLSIDPPTAAPQGDLARDTDAQDVEPRSGHSALLTPDGTRIVVFGGWVGDVNTPATPQLAILEVGTGYGGSGDWSWTVSSAKAPLPDNAGGIYGHGAAMLPGGVMLITGGYAIANSPSSRHRRAQTPAQTPNTKTLLFNTTSLTFISDYTNPSSSSPSSHPFSSPSSSALHSTSQKVGLGTGLGLGFSALASLVIIYLWYSRKMRRRRRQRDSEIRELALGAQRYYHHNDDAVEPSRHEDEEGDWSEKPRQQHQHSIKRKPVPNLGYTPWNQLSPNQQRQLERQQQQQSQMTMRGARDAERTGLLVEIPSPTRGLRRSLYSRPYAYTPAFAHGMHQPPSSAYGPGLGHGPTAGAGGIHPIDERDELEWDAEGKSLRSRKSAKSVVTDEDRSGAEKSRWSDPFKDPPPQVLEPAGPATISVPMTVQQQRPASAAGETTAQAAVAETDELGRTPSQEKRERNAEIAGWVDDWSAAAATLNWNTIRRSGSVMSQGQSRSSGTGGNVSRSASHAHSHSQGDKRSGTMTTTASSSAPTGTGTGSGRGSPDKSDRTNSTLSDMSVQSEKSSLQRSNAGTIRRERSGRSVSAGAVAAASNLFTGAAAAMAAGVAGGQRTSGGRPETREPGGSADIRRPWEREGLLNRTETDRTMYATPPESPVKDQSNSPSKDRANSLGSRAAGFLGSVKKALVGTGAVKRRVEEYEEKEKDGSGSGSWARGSGYWEREYEQSLMQGHGAGQAPRRATSASAAFWRGRKGKADWEDDTTTNANPDGGDPESPTKSSRSEGAIMRPRLVSGEDAGGGEEGDWDVEDAVQQRVVQVMFTVPKEKLRVVNVDPDGLSVISDAREERIEREKDDKGDEGEKDKGKGKERAVE